MQKNATQSTVMRVNNKRKYAHQMRANARKRVFEHAFFDTRLRKNCACVLRVRFACACTVALKVFDFFNGENGCNSNAKFIVLVHVVLLISLMKDQVFDLNSCSISASYSTAQK